MKITHIRQQAKRTDRYSVYVDKKYSFSLSDSQIRNSGLKIGQELKPSDIKRWKGESEDGKVLDRALRWLAVRARSEWELQDYFRRKKIEPDTAQKVTKQILSFGYLDDKTFAESWVRNRRALKSVSKRRLQQELRQKKVPSDIIEAVLDEDETTDQNVLADIIEKKRKLKRYQDDPEKLIAYLARQGFSYSDIKQTLDELVWRASNKRWLCHSYFLGAFFYSNFLVVCWHDLLAINN